MWSTAPWASGTVPDSTPRALMAMLYGRTVKIWEWWWRSFGGEFDYGDCDVGVGLRKILDFVMVITPDAPRKVRSELIGKCNAFRSVCVIHEWNGVKTVLTPFQPVAIIVFFLTIVIGRRLASVHLCVDVNHSGQFCARGRGCWWGKWGDGARLYKMVLV